MKILSSSFSTILIAALVACAPQKRTPGQHTSQDGKPGGTAATTAAAPQKSLADTSLPKFVQINGLDDIQSIKSVVNATGSLNSRITVSIQVKHATQDNVLQILMEDLKGTGKGDTQSGNVKTNASGATFDCGNPVPAEVKTRGIEGCPLLTVKINVADGAPDNLKTYVLVHSSKTGLFVGKQIVSQGKSDTEIPYGSADFESNQIYIASDTTKTKTFSAANITGLGSLAKKEVGPLVSGSESFDAIVSNLPEQEGNAKISYSDTNNAPVIDGNSVSLPFAIKTSDEPSIVKSLVLRIDLSQKAQAVAPKVSPATTTPSTKDPVVTTPPVTTPSQPVAPAKPSEQTPQPATPAQPSTDQTPAAPTTPPPVPNVSTPTPEPAGPPPAADVPADQSTTDQQVRAATP